MAKTLDLPAPFMGRDFAQGVEKLAVEGREERILKNKVTRAFELFTDDDGFGDREFRLRISTGPEPIFDQDGFYGEHDPYFISDLSRLLFRRASESSLRKEGFFPFPEYSSGAELVTLQPLHPMVDDIAATIPRDRHPLTVLLMKALPELGFLCPSMEEFHAATLERLALWALVVRLAQTKGNVMADYAKALVRLMAKTGDEPSRFFGASTRLEGFYEIFFLHEALDDGYYLMEVKRQTEDLQQAALFVTKEGGVKGSLKDALAAYWEHSRINPTVDPVTDKLTDHMLGDNPSVH